MKKIHFGEDGRKLILIGAKTVHDAVASTLGVHGRTVIVGKRQFGKYPLVTKDGANVAKEVFVENPVEAIGADLIREVSENTCKEAGDGTTTSTILAYAMMNKSDSLLKTAHIKEVCRGIDIGVEMVSKLIKDYSIKVDDSSIENIATISANGNNNIGKLVASVFGMIGKDGIVDIQDSYDGITRVSKENGTILNRGIISQYLLKDQKNKETKIQDAKVLLYEGKISTYQQVNTINQLSGGTVLIIADDIDGDALRTLTTNAMRGGGYNIMAIKAPHFGLRRKQIMDDLAVLTGATYISKESGIKFEGIRPEMLGEAGQITITEDMTIIAGGKGDQDKVKNRIEVLKNTANNKPDEEAEFLLERVGILSEGVSVIYVGAKSEVELKEKKDRVEDAICAVKSAYAEGVIPGGGTMYIKAANELINIIEDTNNKDIASGINIVRESILAPVRRMIKNAELDDDIIDKIEDEEPNIGLNFATGEIEDLVKAGVVDPAKVARVALENAASVAKTFMTTNCIIINE